ncbi:DNA polymerase III subunit [Nonlabens ponticola]|uniref:DNA polymerase III subunit delta n=1 Tax=Nonlabens ponticola TaxID=2496866 RepID=A0A3S9MVC3_9FLAO|nr:DNA polymerase III subunit delta' [Nonlabens ponticola]AZQ43136.1 DNA polymerase III subunit delta' [Nonlabens ponticola]
MSQEAVIGLDHIKNHLKSTVSNDRVAHAQLFIGSNGCGVLPLALEYAKNILASNGDKDAMRRVEQLVHPDLHFVFPVATTTRITSKPVSDDFIQEWRAFYKEQPYGLLQDWYQYADIEKKSCEIRVHEAADLSRKLSLKSYEGGAKICIIYGADFMNVAASNKLLKIIEEPPTGTVLILIAESEEQILNTIRSRCQVLHVPKLSAADISQGLQTHYGIDASRAEMISRQANGSFNKAIKLLSNHTEDKEFEEWFIYWVRTAFSAKGKPSAVADLIAWAENIASKNREVQKRFLSYCLEFFRQAMLTNYKADTAVYLETSPSFDLKKFAPFIDGHRIIEITKSIEDALYHIDRNANGKIVMTDLSIGLTRILHKKSR